MIPLAIQCRGGAGTDTGNGHRPRRHCPIDSVSGGHVNCARRTHRDRGRGVDFRGLWGGRDLHGIRSYGRVGVRRRKSGCRLRLDGLDDRLRRVCIGRNCGRRLEGCGRRRRCSRGVHDHGVRALNTARFRRLQSGRGRLERVGRGSVHFEKYGTFDGGRFGRAGGRAGGSTFD